MKRWGILFIFAALISPPLGEAKEQQDQSQRPAEKQQEPPYPLPFPVEIVESEEAASSGKRAEHESAQREKDDLIAQQNMDFAAQRMAEMAMWQTLMLAVGTVALIWTLWESRRASSAAWQAVKDQREIGRKQLRPYLIIEEVEVRRTETANFNKQGFVIAGKVANIGLTHCDRIMLTCECRWNTRFQGESSPSDYLIHNLGAGTEREFTIEVAWHQRVERRSRKEERVEIYHVPTDIRQFLLRIIVKSKDVFDRPIEFQESFEGRWDEKDDINFFQRLTLTTDSKVVRIPSGKNSA